MTKDEAIKALNEYGTLFPSDKSEAIDIAIEALKQVTGKLNNPDDSLLTADSEACKEQKSKLDLISRQAAVDRIDKKLNEIYTTTYWTELGEGYVRACNAARNMLRSLPSVDRGVDMHIVSNTIQSANSRIEFKNLYFICDEIIDAEGRVFKRIVRCGECKHLMPDGRCEEFADDAIRPSASDFCSYGERNEL